jgi:hypothetical protein
LPLTAKAGPRIICKRLGSVRVRWLGRVLAVVTSLGQLGGPLTKINSRTRSTGSFQCILEIWIMSIMFWEHIKIAEIDVKTTNIPANPVKKKVARWISSQKVNLDLDSFNFRTSEYLLYCTRCLGVLNPVS